jgi:dipeptidyl aminopeptidase/acylaminoacyl peptidase
VQAVVNYYGGADLRTWRLDEVGQAAIMLGFDGKNLDQLIGSFVGTMDRSDPRMAAASPATYADADDPPVITFHGTLDILVPIDEARRFDAALKAAGATHELVILEGANHGWQGERLEYTRKLSLEFLNRHLR